MYSNLLSPHLTLSFINNNELKSTYGTHATSSFPSLCCSLNQDSLDCFFSFLFPLLANWFILYSSLGEKKKKNRAQLQLWCLSPYKCSMTLHYRINVIPFYHTLKSINYTYCKNSNWKICRERDKNPSSLLSVSYNTTPSSVNIWQLIRIACFHI